jgi:hypothetical protein
MLFCSGEAALGDKYFRLLREIAYWRSLRAASRADGSLAQLAFNLTPVAVVGA